MRSAIEALNPIERRAAITGACNTSGSAFAPNYHPARALDLSSFLNRRLSGVNINENQENPFQPDLNYRGYTASPLLGRRYVRRMVPTRTTIRHRRLTITSGADPSDIGTIIPGFSFLFGQRRRPLKMATALSR
jgi:hypothetical protein